MLMGGAAGVDLAMLADVLPRCEAAIINPPEPGDQLREDDDGD